MLISGKPHKIMKTAVLKIILLAIPVLISRTAQKFPEIRKTLRERNCIIQIKLRDGSIARHYIFHNGTVKSKAGVHPESDAAIIFKDISTALTFLKPPFNQAEIVHAAKNFRLVTPVRSEMLVWFMQMLRRTQTIGLQYGPALSTGVTRS